MRTSLLPARKMKKLGFTNHVENRWYFVERVSRDGMTTLNITINRETGEYETLVLDEFFGQPEYYMSMKPVYREEIKARVNVIVQELNDAGLNINHDHKEYSYA